MPRVSILMSVYNGEKTLQESLNSIYRQSYTDWELIIINDCSTDNSPDILSSAKAIFYNIKIITNSQNIGLTKSLNKGLLHCSGEYVARIDADDSWNKDKLRKQVAFLDSNDTYGLVATNSFVIDIEGVNRSYNELDLESDPQLKSAMIKFNPFVHSSVLFNRRIVEELGGYDESYKYAQDYNLWARMMAYCKFYKISEKLTYIRESRTSISSLNYRHQKKNAIRIKYLVFLNNGEFISFLLYVAKEALGIITPLIFLRLYRQIRSEKDS